MKQILLWLMTTRPYKWLLRNVIPYIRFTTYYTSFRGHQFHRGYDNLQPGDIILATDKKKLTSLLIPGGVVDHAALCIEKGDWYQSQVVEMTHEDYHATWFFDVCKESTRVIIIRCLDWDDEYIPKVIEKAKSFKDARYDVQFSLGVEALYCSELIYQADFERRLKLDLSDLAGLGRLYISPQGLLEAENCVVVFDSDGVLDDRFREKRVG